MEPYTRSSSTCRARWKMTTAAVLITLTMSLPGFAGISSKPSNSFEAVSPQVSVREANLNYMFKQLKAAKDEQTARFIEMAIWQVWFKSDNQVVASMMEEILNARRVSNYSKAIALLDKLITTYPDYSEAWNQRATVYYMMGNYEASLKDVGETLAREPRHFGALAGRAAIRWQMGDKESAMQSMREAVDIHPYLRDREKLSH